MPHQGSNRLPPTSATVSSVATSSQASASSHPPPPITTAAAASHHNHHHHHPHHHRTIRACHRRAKSAGNASLRDYSHYAATGLYAHQSGENGDSSVTSSQLIPLALPVLKRTASENTLHLVDAQTPIYTPYYFMPYSTTTHRDSDISGGGHHAIKYSTLGAHNSPTDKKDADSIADDVECEIFSTSFPSLQRFAKIQIFVFLCCILVTLQQALSSGYFNRYWLILEIFLLRLLFCSVITTIEKRFDISSRMSGAIVSTFELGNLATIIFVSYFGTHRHIPRWIATGIVVTAIGSLIFSVPHFMSLSGPSDVNKNSSNPHMDNTCRIPKPALTSPFLEKAR